MVDPKRVNYYLVVTGGLVFVAIGLYRVYQGVVPPWYYGSFEATLALAVGVGQIAFGLLWLYVAYRSGGRIGISGGQIVHEE